MKTTLFALAFALTATSASAAINKPGITCKEIGSGAENGYSAYIPTGTTKAEIGETINSTYKKISMLKCEKNAEIKLPAAENFSVIANCAEQFKSDDGYVLTISSGGTGGLTTAVLGELDRNGSNVLAQMNCRVSR